VAAVLAGAALLAGLAWRRSNLVAVRRLVAWATISTVVALSVFVLVNPYLWREPLGGFVGMLQERRDEMAVQQEQWPEFAVLSVNERPWLTAVGSTRVGPWAEMPLVAVPIGLALGIVGLASVALRLRTATLALNAVTTMVLVWLAAYTAAIVAG